MGDSFNRCYGIIAWIGAERYCKIENGTHVVLLQFRLCFFATGKLDQIVLERPEKNALFSKN